MGFGRWGVLAGGLLFGIHPMRVESVAWASERKDVLFALFFFWALTYYLKWLKQAETKESRKGTYIIMLFLALLSCFSKVQAVALPLSMLALDFWLRRLEINWKFVLNSLLTAITGGLIFLVLPRTPEREPFREKIPFWLLSILFGVLNVYTLNIQGSTNDAVTGLNFLDKLCVGAYSYCTYLYKLLLPYPMSPLYSYPKVVPWTVYAAPIGVALALAGFVWALRNDKRIWAFGLLFFTFNVMFVLQIFAAGQGFLADRFTYVAYFGLFAIAAYYLDLLSKKENAQQKVYAALGATTLIFGFWTVQQAGIWKDGFTLWSHVMELNEGKKEKSLLPYFNRGQYLTINKGDYEAAINDYTRAMEIAPGNEELLIIRGKTYFTMANSEKYKARRQELFDKAIRDYTESISKLGSPARTKSEALSSRGTAYGAVGRYEQSINDLTEAILLYPKNKNAYSNRAVAYLNMQQYEKTLADYQEYLKIDPNDPNILYECGMMQRSLRHFEDAISSLNKAIKLNPNLGLAYLERARAKAKLGYFGIKEDYQKAQQLGIALEPVDQQILREMEKQ